MNVNEETKMRSDIALLRNALVGIVGGDGKEELEQIEVGVRALPAPDADKSTILNAIHALRATLPSE